MTGGGTTSMPGRLARLPGARWIPVPLAILLAAVGWLVYGTLLGQSAAAGAQADAGLQLTVDQMTWMSNDMSGQGPVSASPADYGMDPGMMPGMQSTSDNRLHLQIDLKNIAPMVLDYSQDEFHVLGPGGQTWPAIQFDGSSTTNNGNLRPHYDVTLDMYFEVPTTQTDGLSIRWSRPSSSPVTATVNPCANAPHNIFDISAINIKMTLNAYGVNDPNSFMYVLNSNIAAVQAQEQAGTVSSGEQGDDAIQPLVLRAHEGDCVTVDLTNQTTFGLQAFDQSPIENAGDTCDPTPPACDGSLTQTKPENIGWNVDGLPGLSAATVSSGVGQNADDSAAPGQTVSYTVYMDPALGEGAHVFHSTGDTRQTEGHGLFGALIEEPTGSQWLDPHTLQPLQSGWDALIKMPTGPSFREFSLIFHEIGDEGYRQIMEKAGVPAPPTRARSRRPQGANSRSSIRSPPPTGRAARRSTTAANASSSANSPSRSTASPPTRRWTTARTRTATWAHRGRSCTWATPTRSA
ncbi:MAG TPA: hypothetical protein VGM10_05095 [Actinocrinis sp.]